MLNTTHDQLEKVFRELHSIPETDDVRVVEDGDDVSVCLFKDDKMYWGATAAELAIDLIFQQHERKETEERERIERIKSFRKLCSGEQR